jgi:hypothetical protein
MYDLCRNENDGVVHFALVTKVLALSSSALRSSCENCKTATGSILHVWHNAVNQKTALLALLPGMVDVARLIKILYDAS